MYGAGETAATYLAYSEQFTQGVHWLDRVLAQHSELHAVEAAIRPGRIEVVTLGGPGVVRDWVRALPPVTHRDVSIYEAAGLVGMTDVLITDHCKVTVRRPLT